MWFFTPLGFYSVVAKGGADDPQLCVRARARVDIDRLAYALEHYTSTRPEVLAVAGTDYAYRLFIDRHAFACWMKEQVQAIDYANFKDAVAESDPERAHGTYLQVWSVLIAGLGERVRHALTPRRAAETIPAPVYSWTPGVRRKVAR